MHHMTDGNWQEKKNNFEQLQRHCSAENNQEKQKLPSRTGTISLNSCLTFLLLNMVDFLFSPFFVDCNDLRYLQYKPLFNHHYISQYLPNEVFKWSIENRKQKSDGNFFQPQKQLIA